MMSIYTTNIYRILKGSKYLSLRQKDLSLIFLENPELIKTIDSSLKESEKLKVDFPGASLVFSAITIEVGIKNTLLKPVVYGLVHEESVATLVTNLVMTDKSFQKLQGLLFKILSTYGEIDLRSEKRMSSTKTLWEEVLEVMKGRNRLMHAGELPSLSQVELGLSVAGHIVNRLVPQFLNKLKLRLVDNRVKE